jgi:hypothetical protein
MGSQVNRALRAWKTSMLRHVIARRRADQVDQTTHL